MSGRPAGPRAEGSVYLVGAGPGDPGLITVRGLALLRAADAVVYDRLVSPTLLEFARPDAERIFVGKAPRRHALGQEEINGLLVRLAGEGHTVVRLKGGDPFVFGRGGEEAEALAQAGVEFEVVPGVTSATAAPAAAGIPVTDRRAAASVAIATAHEAPDGAGSRLDWHALARTDTVVLLMGVERLEEAAKALMAGGKPRSTPAAVVQEATLPGQRTVVAPLHRIAAAAKRAGIRSPAVTIVGDVVELREAVGGWESRPLAGVRVLVSRSREQASELSAVLRELGGMVVEAPAIRIQEPRTAGPMDRAVQRLATGGYEWVVLTSANGVRALGRGLERAGLDARAARARVAAVGSGTAGALAALGIRADLVPDTYTTEAVGRAFPTGSGRILLARADAADRSLDEVLSSKGWAVDRVVAYRLAGASRMPPGVRRAVADGEFDVLTFASAATVRAFARLSGSPPPRRTKVVCIGPVTAAAAREAGMRIAAVAEEHTIPGLAAAVVRAVGRRRA